MTPIDPKHCPDCHSVMNYQKVDQEFEKEGIRAIVSGILGWKCPKCGAVSFKPEVAEHVVHSARELIEAAKVDYSGLITARAVEK